MKTAVIVTLAAAALVAAAMPATAATETRSGSFLVGEPVGFFATDACGNAALQGINSQCIPLIGFAGAGYELTVQSTSTTDLRSGICFYSATSRLACDPASGLVPAGATRAAITALGGVQVTWTLALHR